MLSVNSMLIITMADFLQKVNNFYEWGIVRRLFQFANDTALRRVVYEMLMVRWRELRADSYQPQVIPNISMRNDMDFTFTYRIN